MNDLYRFLGVNENASQAEIKNAYRKLSKKFHPDVNDGDKFFEERFKEIQSAYEILSDSTARTRYNVNKAKFGNEQGSAHHDFTSQSENLRRKKEELRKKEEELRRREEELKRKAEPNGKGETNAKVRYTAKKHPAFLLKILVSIVVITVYAAMIELNTAGLNDSWPGKNISETKSERILEILKSGLWQGTAHQFNINEAWSIQLSYDKGSEKFIVKYPSLNCVGYWSQTKSTHERIEFNEVINTGQDICNNGGHIVLKMMADDRFEYLYYWPDNETLDSKGEIIRIDGTQQQDLDKKVGLNGHNP